MGKARRVVPSSPVAQHKHCPICGEVMQPDEEYCSAKCEEVAAKRRKDEQRLRIIWYVLLIVMMLILLLPLLLQYKGF
ncbi:DUF2116 family Zn-ribbon domain-containing protein [Candidatus Bathyarchaeota archaeon]|nr:DUF2116 family Zn-ribbon domain-containing protein [Candidatus Bathyarchaeota archaeon]